MATNGRAPFFQIKQMPGRPLSVLSRWRLGIKCIESSRWIFSENHLEVAQRVPIWSVVLYVFKHFQSGKA